MTFYGTHKEVSDPFRESQHGIILIKCPKIIYYLKQEHGVEINVEIKCIAKHFYF